MPPQLQLPFPTPDLSCSHPQSLHPIPPIHLKCWIIFLICEAVSTSSNSVPFQLYLYLYIWKLKGRIPLFCLYKAFVSCIPAVSLYVILVPESLLPTTWCCLEKCPNCPTMECCVLFNLAATTQMSPFSTLKEVNVTDELEFLFLLNWYKNSHMGTVVILLDKCRTND